MSDAAAKLTDLTKRLDACDQNVGQLEGRQVAAQEELVRVTAECTELGVEPEGLEAAIAAALQAEEDSLANFDQAVQALETDVQAAEQAMEGAPKLDGGEESE